MDEAKLLELFVRIGYITKDQSKEAFTKKDKNESIINTLIRLGFLDEEKLIDFYTAFMPNKVWKGKLEDVSVPEDILRKIPENFIKEKLVVPVGYREDGRLEVIMLNPYDQSIVNEIRFRTKINTIITYAAPKSAIENIISKLYPETEKIFEEINLDNEVEIESPEMEIGVDIALKESDEAPIVKLGNGIIFEAVNLGASDIHIEPQEKEVLVRYRVDGILKVYHRLPSRIKDALIARFKIMANVKIEEKRLPQDGRIRIKISGRKIDLRFSTVPTVYGEKIVMRVQEAEKYLNVKLDDLGFEPDDLEKFRRAIWTPWGMVLVTGPTGSGKTTTLYSALMERNSSDVNIMTAEDPVEVSIPGLNQVHVKEDIGLTFANVLRAFLRQDPDIILIGEIRDRETAEIGVKAALTGHLVFSTLHTNDAPSTITRLVDMGIEPFLVGSSVILIVAQRLIRKLCPKCKRPADVPKEALLRMGVVSSLDEDVTVYTHSPEGCEFCKGSGYKGRIAVHELLQVDEDLRRLIVKGATAEDIKDLAKERGMRTLYQSGLLKVRKGLTSLEELERVLAK